MPKKNKERRFRNSRDAALADLCIENEVVRSVDDIMKGG
jgi:hypothetical protein